MPYLLLALAAVQILHCSAVPVPEDALRASVLKLNYITEIPNLCGITGRRMTNTYRTGKLSYNVDLTFSVKETVCSKNSGLEFDDPSCYFRPRKIAEGGFCKSRVEYFADKVAYVDVECEGLKTVDSESDSMESSETRFEDLTELTESSLEDISNVKSRSEESSLEEHSNRQSQSEDLSLEASLKVKTRSVETSLENTSDVRSQSEETEVRESSNAKSQSTELSHEEFSNEHEDSRHQH
ncbi:secreted phosphoprotein 24-like isoform X2 [Narcine bancroftii]|uniref:secreted phosphoprotein 24-like isoform X2 n=1 Tax=Narcine bancroftii TaxID=1343680 RepID=UPI0038312D50